MPSPSFSVEEVAMILDRLLRAQGITKCYCCGGMILDNDDDHTATGKAVHSDSKVCSLYMKIDRVLKEHS